jgi:hypothetical protein
MGTKRHNNAKDATENRDMNENEIIFGLLDTSEGVSSREDADRARDLTIAWSRFKYFGPFIEDTQIDRILARASDLGMRYCLIQSYGHILSEIWSPEDDEAAEIIQVLGQWIQEHDFFVAGHVLHDDDQWFGLDTRCLLVNIEKYTAFSRPVFDLPCDEAINLADANVQLDDGGAVRCMLPSGQAIRKLPRQPGWNFINTALQSNLPVFGFDPAINASMIYLDPKRPIPFSDTKNIIEQSDNTAEHDANIAVFEPKERQFLLKIQELTQNLRNGVFVWNIESYADIETPSPAFTPPLTSLYTVAAGFKPNRILETHQFDANTRMVIFDYSSQGLEYRRMLHEEWDGIDYPAFLRRLFRKIPTKNAYYLLWDGMTPDNLDWDLMADRWQQELDAWGGEQAFNDHWDRFQQVDVEYVECDVLSQQHRLLEHIRDEPNALIWWSNAFFSIYSNWLYSADERNSIYRKWIESLAHIAPQLLLYGSDCYNISVNAYTADEYWSWLKTAGSTELEPKKLHRHELRF